MVAGLLLYHRDDKILVLKVGKACSLTRFLGKEGNYAEVQEIFLKAAIGLSSEGRLFVEANYGVDGGKAITDPVKQIIKETKIPIILFSGAVIADISVVGEPVLDLRGKKEPPKNAGDTRVWIIQREDLTKNPSIFVDCPFRDFSHRDIELGRDLEESRDIEPGRDFAESRDIEPARDFLESRDIDSNREIQIAEGTNQVRHLVNIYTQIASNSDLRKLRLQGKGLFDTLLQHAVPFALNAAQTAVSLIGRNRDLGVDDIAVHRHLPTALNLAHQIQTLPEVQADRGLFDKIFSVGMPLVLNIAQTLLGAKRGLGSADDAAERGFFDSVVANLPGTVFSVLSNAAAKRDLEAESRDVGGERGFFDVLKKFAPIVLNVAGAAVNSLPGQRSLAFVPTDRGFFSKIASFAKKIASNPLVKQIGGMVLSQGVGLVKSMLTGRAIGEPAPSTEAAESHVRGFFGSMLQSLTPIAMGALQGAVNSIGKQDIDGGRDLAVAVQERGIFDIVAQYLPVVIQVAQQNFAKKRALGGVTEDESQYLNRVVNTVSVPLIVAAQRQIANPSVEGERGILGSILGGLVPF